MRPGLSHSLPALGKHRQRAPRRDIRGNDGRHFPNGFNNLRLLEYTFLIAKLVTYLRKPPLRPRRETVSFSTTVNGYCDRQ
jgi:hypothetical protein